MKLLTLVVVIMSVVLPLIALIMLIIGAAFQIQVLVLLWAILCISYLDYNES